MYINTSFSENVFNTSKNLEHKKFAQQIIKELGEKLKEAYIKIDPEFDNVYHYHFKCNLKKIADYKNLSKYLNQFRNLDCIKKTLF